MNILFTRLTTVFTMNPIRSLLHRYVLPGFVLYSCSVFATNALDQFIALYEGPNDEGISLEHIRKDPRNSNESIRWHNTELFRLLAQPFQSKFPDGPCRHNNGKIFSKKRNSFTYSEAAQLLEQLRNHPIASPRATANRDDGDGIGFCFGRAYHVHMDALRYACAKPDVVKKLWVVGLSKTDSGSRKGWAHHVTTIVKATEGGWWTIDPIAAKTPIQASDWMIRFQSFNEPSKDAMFFVTRAQRFAPSSALPYRSIDLKDELNYYKGFFNDLQAYERKLLLEKDNPIRKKYFAFWSMTRSR